MDDPLETEMMMGGEEGNEEERAEEENVENLEMYPAEIASSTHLYDRIERNKFNGSRRCKVLTAAIVVIFLLNAVVAAFAAAWNEYDILLCAIGWIGTLASLVVALVFVINAEANALTQHNTYGFARAEVVGAVIVCTFIAGATVEATLEALEIFIVDEFIGSEEVTCPIDDREKDAEWSFHLKIYYFGIDAILRLIIISIILAYTFSRRSTKGRQLTNSDTDSTEDVVKWRSYNDTLLLHAFNLNIATGLVYDGLKFFITTYEHFSGQATEEEHVATTSVPLAHTNSSVEQPSCTLWLQYLDETSFALSNLMILPPLIWLLRRSCLIVLQTVPPKFNAYQLKEKLLLKVSGLTSVHEFHLWQLDAKKIIVTLHVNCSREQSQAEYENLREEITAFFHDEGIHSITVQPEFVDPEAKDERPSCQLYCKEEWSGPSCYKLQCCLEEQQNLQKSQGHLHVNIEAADELELG